MITSFSGKYDWLSNFYRIQVKYEGMSFPTVEHAYQAAKTIDWTERRRIADSPTPGIAKQRGRHVHMRTNWDSIKLEVMEGLLRQKFSDPHLAQLLKDTGVSQLIEGNSWGDHFWGASLGLIAPGFSGWVGENHLGKLLEKLRGELQEGKTL